MSGEAGEDFRVVETGADRMELTLKGLSAGTHVVQVQNPGGWFSNEMPVFAE